MSNTTNATTAPKIKLIPAVLHARDDKDLAVAEELFNFEKAGFKITKRITGLDMKSQRDLMMADASGKAILTTGLPTDIAATYSKVTRINAWKKTRDDGSFTSGSTPPVTYAVLEIKDSAAYQRLASNPDFLAAIGEESEEEADV
jgi:hypothetical protein